MIKLIVLDVDGTLTNGDISYTNNNEELKTFNVKDGLAVASWTKKLSKKAAIITGRESKIVEKRATELGITHLFQKIDNKEEVLQAILDQEQISWDEVAAIGDDLNDLKMLKKVGLSFAPNDAVEYIQQRVNVVTASKGGEGAVREMVEYILQYDNLEGLESLWE